MSTKEYVPLKLEELAAVLAVPREDISELSAILKELENEGKIFLTRKQRYELGKKAGYIAGALNCSSYGRFAFLTPIDEDEDEIYIGPDSMADAYNSDTVLVSVDVKNPRTGKREGHVTKVLKRGNERLTGIVKEIDDEKVKISVDSRKIYARLICSPENAMDAKEGDRVLFEITGYPEKGKIQGIITKNLGSADELRSNVEAIIQEHNIKQEFDSRTLEEAKNAPKRISQKEISSRLDLRDELIFTIDGDDARDFDDAVSLKITEDGKFLLGVHIADVSSYVTPGSALDNEAFLRGTSVYLADRVIPMLPEELSNGICSLNPHVNRLALSAFIKIDKNGTAQLEGLSKSVIRSAERMTYNNAADLLENPTPRLLKKYDYLLPTLKNMQKLAEILNNARMRRGSINFDFPEAHIKVNDMGEPIDVVKSERRISHKIIEEFMLIANETIAEVAFWAELPFIYRVHEPPTPEKTEDFNRFLLNFGYSLKGKIDKDNPPHPKAFQQVLDKISGTESENMISTYMLRSLMKAQYSPENLGHFGLSAKYYCHFTSPIRRYPDLFIHRVLKAYIDSVDTSYFIQKASEAAKNSSETEREAEYCERDTDDLMKTAFMSSHIGEEFEATVSSVMSFGIFAELDNTVEGLIRLDTMRDDFYEFDEVSRTIKGKRNNRSYKIGDKINVILTQCDLLTRRIDFVRSEDFSLQDLKKRRNNKNERKRNTKKSPRKNVKNKRKFGKKRKKI